MPSLVFNLSFGEKSVHQEFIEKYHLNKYELHRLLSMLLSMKLTVDEKLGIIEKEYSIPVDDRIREHGFCGCVLFFCFTP